MVVLECNFFDCAYKTTDSSEIIAVCLLNNHTKTHKSTTNGNNVNSNQCIKGPKIERPSIDMGVDDVVWNAFICRWNLFRHGYNLDNESVSMQLFQCAAEYLGNALLKADSAITSRPFEEVLAAIRQAADEGLASAILTGDEKAIHAIAKEHKISLDGFEIINCVHGILINNSKGVSIINNLIYNNNAYE